MRSLRHPGVQSALASAVLFGAGTPLAKLLLGDLSPWLLAGLLYTGSGLGLTAWRLVRRVPRVAVTRHDLPPLAGAVTLGGLIAPVLLMTGLSAMPASGAALLLNAEAVFTALLAWTLFGENLDRRVALGMVAVVAGALVLGSSADAAFGAPWPALAVLGAAFCWGLDNNLTRRVALTDATWLAAVKGAVAGPVNLGLAVVAGASWPSTWVVGTALLLGLVTYGVSLALFIVGLRQVGTARAGAYFSVAPFFGAIVALALGDPLTVPLALGALSMAVGVWLHLSEHHEHVHAHAAVTHEHWHTHDDHHAHDHPPGSPPILAGRHRHRHTHDAVLHSHEHYPDAHHRHDHR